MNKPHRWRYKLVHVEAKTWYVLCDGNVYAVNGKVWMALDNQMGEQEAQLPRIRVYTQFSDDSRIEETGIFSRKIER